MYVLGIESSCDETSVAVVADAHRVLSNLVASQVACHAPYGGVIPELAAREHLRAVRCLTDAALAEAKVDLAAIDAVAVTNRPGLLTALLVGLSYAKGLAAACDLPLIAVNHVQAHLFGAFLDCPERLQARDSYPLLTLVVSGGHTLLVTVSAAGDCEIIGRTLDDAAGEAFDKAARILDLGYPGGAVIDRLAQQGDRHRFDFPRGLTGGGGTPVRPEHRLDFSFSGVKTALLYHVRDLAPERLALELRPERRAATGSDRATDQDILDTVASYQEAVVEALALKLRWAAEDVGAGTLVLCGGVACNSRLRQRVTEVAAERGAPVVVAPPRYCTDNAAMIAGLGCRLASAGQTADLSVDAAARLGDLGRLPLPVPTP